MKNKEPMKSPLSNSANTRLEKEISIANINKQYMDALSIDVSYLFGQYENLNLYRCLDTGYGFYHPFNIIGDSKFYENLQKFSWYYMPWKWEHEQTISYFKKGMHVLEIGCGDGAYIKKIAEVFNVIPVGLEMNDEAIKSGEENGLTIKKESIQRHALRNSKKYDVVCCFQVLEHIAEVHDFIESALKCLKQGGLLIVSVPNNDSFIFKKFDNVLNIPPHHMGLWNKKSLKALAKIFNLSIIKIKKEPLQEYHYHYADLYIDSKLPIGTYLKKIIKNIIPIASKIISGHTIFFVYRKIKKVHLV